MIIYKKFKDYNNHFQIIKSAGKKVGFVPTMGALHAGHLTLIKQCKKVADITVASIFVNPTQFNNSNDFDQYPITLDRDIYELETNGCDILLLPSKEEVYPSGYHYKPHNLGNLENILEGAYRPGHFQGVCQVVERLLNVVTPDILLLGQKDFQQVMVIKRLLELSKINLELIISPTIRESSGLAMSSRNARLSAMQKEMAITIYKVLNFIRQHYESVEWSLIKEDALKMLQEVGFKVDYIEIATTDSLTIVNSYTPGTDLIALIAATIGQVRLIDNMLLNETAGEIV